MGFLPESRRWPLAMGVFRLAGTHAERHGEPARSSDFDPVGFDRGGWRAAVAVRVGVAFAAYELGYFLVDTVELRGEPEWSLLVDLAKRLEPDAFLVWGAVDVPALESLAVAVRSTIRLLAEADMGFGAWGAAPKRSDAVAPGMAVSIQGWA